MPGYGKGGDQIYVQWTGKLIVPVSGTYTFSWRYDDVGALWVNHLPIVNVWSGQGARTTSGSCYLEKGVYPIRADLADWWAGEECELRWTPPYGQGELVPQTQLIPEKWQLPEPWIGERTFNQSKKGMVGFLENGDLLLQGGGGDFLSNSEKYHALWTKRTGDFCLTFAYRRNASSANSPASLLLMVRNAMGYGGPVYAPCVTSGATAEAPATLQCRTRGSSGAAIENLLADQAMQVASSGWLRLIRDAEEFSFYHKAKGTDSWQLVHQLPADPLWEETLFVGPAIASSGDTVEGFTLSNLMLGDIPPKTTMIILQ